LISAHQNDLKTPKNINLKKKKNKKKKKIFKSVFQTQNGIAPFCMGDCGVFIHQ
jgi:hypothetical protein